MILIFLKYLFALLLCNPLFFLPCPPAFCHQDSSQYTEVIGSIHDFYFFFFYCVRNQRKDYILGTETVLTIPESWKQRGPEESKSQRSHENPGKALDFPKAGTRREKHACPDLRAGEPSNSPVRSGRLQVGRVHASCALKWQ